MSGCRPTYSQRVKAERKMLASQPDHFGGADIMVAPATLPEWDIEGNPMNLKAAAEDAYEWLIFMQGRQKLSAIGRQRLEDCAKGLRKFIDQ